jgi:hypothetical protein
VTDELFEPELDRVTLGELIEGVLDAGLFSEPE